VPRNHVFKLIEIISLLAVRRPAVTSHSKDRFANTPDGGWPCPLETIMDTYGPISHEIHSSSRRPERHAYNSTIGWLQTNRIAHLLIVHIHLEDNVVSSKAAQVLDKNAIGMISGIPRQAARAPDATVRSPHLPLRSMRHPRLTEP
jgi:hypothetical protein